MKYLSLLIIACCLFSCKDDKDEACSLSAQNFIGTYRLVAVTYQATPSSTIIDQFATDYEQCEKDDVVTFNANGTYFLNDIGVVCAPSGDYEGTWALNGSTIISDEQHGTVEDFSCSGFKVVLSDLPGERLTLTYIRQ